MSAADQFTRFTGYQEIYDRPQKYFWRDMDEMIKTDLAALDPFDLLYLTDTTLEAIGTRREGWEVRAEATLNYSTRYTEDDTFQSGSNTSNSTTLQPAISGLWSKNLSLKHQLGLSGNIISLIRLNSDASNVTLANVSAQWLYTITDRILSRTSIILNQSFSNPKSGQITANSEVDYFIEDKFSLFSNILMVHRPKFLQENKDRRSVRIAYTAGCATI